VASVMDRSIAGWWARSRILLSPRRLGAGGGWWAEGWDMSTLGRGVGERWLPLGGSKWPAEPCRVLCEFRRVRRAGCGGGLVGSR
jgi:hypothetical protein